ncbi:11874_t:CDS:2, partial [Rhizophagus irregularis]
IERFRQKCNNPLVKKIDSNKDGGNNPIIRPIMTFPLVNIRRQLTLFFGRKDFEVTCRKWAERENETEALFDIYDGRIWMSFEDGKGEPFFKKEYAETHIGLMLNMDWFQPYINSQYSVGVIYAVICNLPRSERFKPYNILTLAVIPGPKEPKKHEINNYLYPIINQLNRLWEGYHIKTYEYNNSRFIRSYKNSKRNIEPELLKIMVESSFLNYYLTNCDSNILNTTLDIIKPRKSAGSLAALDDFTSDEYQNFLRLSLIENESAYGTERFPGLLMKPRQETCLPNRVLDLLVEFYNSLYEEHFVPIYSIT